MVSILAEERRETIDARAFRGHCTALLEALGVTADDAATTVDVFLQAELMGEESHGLRLLLHVLGRIEAGGDRAKTDITVVTDRGAIALWNANRSLGQVTAVRAMARAIEKAREHGLGLVTVRNGNSLTSAKYYALQAARAGMIGFVYTNTRILRARDLSIPIPSGWALDSEGRETTDAAEALKSMSLLPFGGYKAFGIAMVNEIVTSVLNGGLIFAGDSTGFQPYAGPMHTSFTLQAIDIAAFQPVTTFERRMETFLDTIKAAEPREPGARILFPGERAQAEQLRRTEAGIPVVAQTLDKLQAWADRLGVARLTRS